MLAAVEMNMSSRIIRGNEDARSVRVTAGGMGVPSGHAPLANDTAKLEKQAFEKGYKEGERIGKQMGERMMESTVSRYERSIQQLAVAERKLAEAMEAETVRLSLQIARKILRREAAIDPEMVSVLVSVALSERLKNGAALYIIQTLDPMGGWGTQFALLQHGRKLNFRWKLFHSDQVLARQNDGVFNRVLQFSNITWP